MIPVEFYEATIADRDTGLRATVYSIPQRVIPQWLVLDSQPREAFDEGSMSRFVGALFEQTELVPLGPFIADVLNLLPSLFSDQLIQLGLEESDVSGPGPPEEQPVRSFLTYLVSAPLIPIEESPIRRESIAALVTQGLWGGTTTLYSIVEREPTVVLIGAFGIIAIRAAVGIGGGLEEGLRYRILRALGVPTNTEERVDRERKE